MELEEREWSRKRLREEESNTVQPKIDETLCVLNPYTDKPAPRDYHTGSWTNDCNGLSAVFYCGG